MKHYSRLGFLLSILFFVTGVQPIFAGTDGYFEIKNGLSKNFRYSGIHETGDSSFIYSDLNGRLDVDRNTVGLLSLTNITGTLSAKTWDKQNQTSGVGTIIIKDGELSEDANGWASGFLKYSLTGLLNESGIFNFEAQQECCSSAILGGPNHLTLDGFILWGGNSPNPHGTSALGIDLVGGQYIANPEPSTILLFGTGLLALPFLRRKKV